MPEFAPRAKENREKGRHPDLTEDGNLRADVFDDDPRRREFRRMWQNPAEQAQFMARLAQRQRQLPQDVQEYVGGRLFNGYDNSGDPYAGYREYLQTIQDVRDPNEVTDADIERMSLDEYDARFDERGRPRPGVTYHPTQGRSIDVTTREGIDPFSTMELRNR